MPGVPLARPGSVDIEIRSTNRPLSEFFRKDAGSSLGGGPYLAPRENGNVYLHWPGLCELVVSADGRNITLHEPAKGQRLALQAYPLTQALSFSLTRLGREPLHATTVKVADGAIALLGDCGYGKSTLAAAFVKQGHTLLSDDLLVAKLDDEKVFCYPGTGKLKLHPEVASTVLGHDVRGESLAPIATKMAIGFGSRREFPEHTRLQSIYVLDVPGETGDTNHVSIQQVQGRDAVVQLLKNTYNDMIRGDERLSRQFSHAGAIADRLPIKRLKYPRSLERLGEVYDAIMADLRS